MDSVVSSTYCRKWCDKESFILGEDVREGGVPELPVRVHGDGGGDGEAGSGHG